MGTLGRFRPNSIATVRQQIQLRDLISYWEGNNLVRSKGDITVEMCTAEERGDPYHRRYDWTL